MILGGCYALPATETLVGFVLTFTTTITSVHKSACSLCKNKNKKLQEGYIKLPLLLPHLPGAYTGLATVGTEKRSRSHHVLSSALGRALIVFI
jgi:hypothetical protein